MDDFRYIDEVTTLTLDENACIGCGMCLAVCPHGVFAAQDRKVKIIDRNGCMECGACAMNCPVEALRVQPGVGCAAYIIQSWIKGKENASCGDGGCC